MKKEGLLPAAFRQSIRGGIQVCDLGDGWEWDLDDFTVRAFHLHARRGQGLRGFHATNNAADSLPINGCDLDVVFAV